MSTPGADTRPTTRVQLALEGTLAQGDLTPDEARQVDAAIAARIDDAVAQADFSAAALPDFAAVVPDPYRVLADLESRPEVAVRARNRLHEALANVE